MAVAVSLLLLGTLCAELALWGVETAAYVGVPAFVGCAALLGRGLARDRTMTLPARRALSSTGARTAPVAATVRRA